jgi:quinoprotein glucose dehydrogenase
VTGTPFRLPTIVAVAASLAALSAAPVAAADASLFLDRVPFPTNLAFAPDGRLFFTERETGNVRIVEEGRLLEEPFFHVDVALSANETGLLGLALDPGFPQEPWVYAYFTDAADGRNRVIRIRARGDRGVASEILLDGLAATSGYHNGGDLAFGADGMLYVSVGEGHEPTLAQDPSSIGGKILRISPDGDIPADGPFGPEVAAFTIGHRNSFGLCLDAATGTLWETENGPTGNDEINELEAGGNYGWPTVMGVGGDPDLVDPVLVFARTIAPTGCAVVDGTLYFGSYAESKLRRLSTDDPASSEVVAEIPGGITDVAPGPDGGLYVATTEAIWWMPIDGATSTPSPVDDGSAGGSRPWVPVIAAVVLAGGLALRLIAGRRLRARTREPRSNADAR